MSWIDAVSTRLRLLLSRGEAGTTGTPEIREREARDAAARMGASIEFLDFGGDCNLQYTPDNRLRIAREIRTFEAGSADGRAGNPRVLTTASPSAALDGRVRSARSRLAAQTDARGTRAS